VAGAACSSSSSSPPAPAAPIPVAANQVPPDSPLAVGQQQFLYETWGLEKVEGWPPTSFMLNLMTSEPDVFGNQFSQFGFLPDPNDDLPIGFKRGSVDPTKVSQTCGLCHTAKLPDGRVWMGAPNEDLDTGRFALEVDKRWVAAGNPSMIDAITTTEDAETGPGRISAQQSESDPLVPDDIPDVYNLAQRGWLSKMGTSRDLRSEVYLSLFGAGVGYPDPQSAVIPFPSDSTLATFVSFFGSLDPPSPPPGGDATLIAAGKAVYASQKCDSCHHLGQLEDEGVVTVDDNPGGQDRLPGVDPSYPRGSVHTSPLEYAVLEGVAIPGVDGGAPADAGGGCTSFGNGFQTYIQFIAVHGLRVEGSDGYVVPDLRALWASAPYLHNGSIGTLSDLLDVSSARATTFEHDGFTVDTTQEMNANYGHQFGSTLSASDKAALVAYLNSL
jgi:hypothetical protein